jgi:hypothetical protein
VARPTVALLALVLVAASCGSSPLPSSTSAGAPDGASPRLDGGGEAGGSRDSGSSALPDAGDDASPDGEAGSPIEGGDALASSRFVTGVVSFTPGECAGYGASSMPAIVEGPPYGGGTSHGGTDVVSLGGGGSIVVSFAPNAIVDGPGPDFIVFENPFWVGGNSSDVYTEPGEVSVSDDGVTWQTFPCNPAPDPRSPHGTGVAPPYGGCAGWHVVLSSPTGGISPLDPAAAGGDAFDLSAIGVTHARYVRVVDRTNEDCPETGSRPDTNGFDLDAVAIVNAESP